MIDELDWAGLLAASWLHGDRNWKMSDEGIDYPRGKSAALRGAVSGNANFPQVMEGFVQVDL